MLDIYANKRLSELCSDCLTKSTEKSILAVLKYFEEIISFKFSIVSKIISDIDGKKIIITTNHVDESEWMNFYLENDYINIDPVIDYALYNTSAFSWGKCLVLDKLNAEQKQYSLELKKIGLENGVTLAIQKKQSNQTVITLCSLAGMNKNKNNIAKKLLYIALPVFNNVLEKTDKNDFTVNVVLTKKEKEVLKWVSEGKTAWETGKIMHISESTVKFHLKNIYRNMCVTNKGQAVAFALKNRLI